MVDTYKEALRQLVLSYGINEEEIKYWDFLLKGFDEQQAKDVYERIQKYPDLLMVMHKDLLRKCMLIKTRGGETEARKIIEAEKKDLKDIISS